jgi:hypothetical protein
MPSSVLVKSHEEPGFTNMGIPRWFIISNITVAISIEAIATMNPIFIQ